MDGENEIELEVREIVAIDAVARTRNFKIAAETLNTTQPTLSRLIASSERKLAITLFNRGWSRIRHDLPGRRGRSDVPKRHRRD